jgi:hypothetical protein
VKRQQKRPKLEKLDKLLQKLEGEDTLKISN